MNKYAIGDNVTNKLRRMRMSQRKFAELMNVTEWTVSHWMTGKRMMSAYALYRAAKILGCTMDELMEGIEDDR